MSTNQKRSTRKPSKTKRRDGDPVRVHADGRISYWTGGRPGEGTRMQERCGSLAKAETRAMEVRAGLAKTHGLGPRDHGTLDEAFQDFLVHLRSRNSPTGTVNQYKSNWNRWIPAEVGRTPCLKVSHSHLARILDGAVKDGASPSTIRNIARTLGSFTKWAVAADYFISDEPFGGQQRRQGAVEDRLGKVKDPDQPGARAKNSPTTADVQKFAEAFEELYPGYGRRLVLLAFATGLRINELLSLRHDSIDLATGAVSVDTQLDRHADWPATILPKGRKTRTSSLWSCYDEVAASLIADSLAFEEGDVRHGWLFPQGVCPNGGKRWAEAVGKLSEAAVDNCGWEWTFHWLRHAFATYCIRQPTSGGYGIEPADVQAWLGHTKLSTTMDMYVAPLSNAGEVARRRTAQAPE